MKTKLSFLVIQYLYLSFFCIFSTIFFAPLANAEILFGYTGCTFENQFQNQCLPNVSNIEERLNALHENQVSMDVDRHSWRGLVDGDARPSDDMIGVASKEKAKKHVQSIQYIGNVSGDRYLITSLGDETSTDLAAVQLIKTDEFAAGGAGGWDDIAVQRLLNADPDTPVFDFEQGIFVVKEGVAGFNHPGGSQLIGNYLFLALEDFTDFSEPATGVWRVDPTRGEESIRFMYKIDGGFEGDYHQSTAAVTKLADGTFLLANCVYEKCDYINFYKSSKTALDEPDTVNYDPGFRLIHQWYRFEPSHWADGLIPGGNYWDDCAPQNMNFAVQDDGEIYLVMFGGVNNGWPVELETDVTPSGCQSGIGYDDHLYAYKLKVDESDPGSHDITFEFTNKVDVLPNPSPCNEAPGIFLVTDFFHGLNFEAGAGLWLRPDGKDDIAFLATEHYDSCRSYTRPVNGKTRWGVSSNWNGEPRIWTDNYRVEVNEGDLATNTGIFESGDAVTLSASLGAILEDYTDTWSWSWLTNDGPDDSQTVTVTRTEGDDSDSAYFELVVNNVPPTADAGPDQVVECVHGNTVALDATGSSDPGDDTLSFAWAFSGVPGSSAPDFDDSSFATPSFLPNALGTYLAEVTVTDDDGASDTDNVAILFEDTTPPVIASLGATPDVLWPPNGKMVGIEASVTVTDACDTAPVCAISSITSNEPELDEPDSEITGPFTANLRAKRLGAGEGRSYTIAVQCSDYAGNSTTRTTAVIVPHDQGM